MKFKIQHYIFFVIILSSCGKQLTDDFVRENNQSNYRLYHQYCFYNDLCTDSMLVSIVINDKKSFLNSNDHRKNNIYKRIDVERVNPVRAVDKEIVQQFLRSLEVYNLSKLKKNYSYSSLITPQLFFENNEFKDHYHLELENEQFISVQHLADLRTYDFSQRITEVFKEKTVEITFDNGIETKIICSKKIHQQELFPKYLNYLSKQRRATNRNLTLSKQQ